MNLREQFLKSGLITKKQANKAQAEKNKQAHLLKKDKALLEADKADKEQAAQEILREQEAQRLRDKELNKKRDLLLAEREKHYRALQIIYRNAQNEKASEEIYFFTEGNIIRRIYVTAWQRETIARGLLGIVKPDITVDEFILLPRINVQTILEICPEKIIVLHSVVENFEDFNFT